VSCYLNDNDEKSFKIFTSYSTNNNSAFEYFKNNLNESWIEITESKISDNHFFTYVETKELFEQEEIGYFIEEVNKYYHLPSDLYHEFQTAAGISDSLHSSSSFASQLANKKKIQQEKYEDLADARSNHNQNGSCNLIFTDSHFDATVWKVIKKISPKLKSLGYNCFFMEAPEGTTVHDGIDNHRMYIEQRIDKNIVILKLKADLGQLPKEYFYSNEENILATRAYFSKISAIECLQNFTKENLEYAGIDCKELINPSTHDYMVSEEGIAKRNHKMASAYLASSNPVFGLIGWKHALGMQNEILLQLSLPEAQKKFCFVHVYSESPLDEDEANFLTRKIEFPLGVTFINAKEMSEEKIIELILESACPKNPSCDSALSDFSIFRNQICITPSATADWQVNADTTTCKEFQPAGPGYGF
jgi:hypothetical protein